ncbi:MAG: HD domain-containing protein [Azospirillum sp.]|nr:HD domain-containing protein [Azospirillum sp.]
MPDAREFSGLVDAMTDDNHSKSSHIAVVDDYDKRRRHIASVLRPLYRVVEYSSSVRAVHGLGMAPPGLVLVDQDTLPHGGPEFVRLLRQNEACRKVPVVLIAKNDKDNLAEIINQCGANAFLPRPFRRSTLIKCVSALMNAQVERKWDELPTVQRVALRKSLDLFNSISDALDEGGSIEVPVLEAAFSPLVEAVTNQEFQAILSAVKGHDNYSYVHSLRVATLLTLFAHAIGLRKSDLTTVAGCGLLHDVGKLSISHEVLNKPGKLTSDEWAVMRGHVNASVQYLEAVGTIPRPIIAIAHEHHEKLNGSGYPRGLTGSEINELTRMATIVDIFSALTDVRVYKAPVSVDRALAIMTEESPGHLDQRLLAMFGSVLLDVGLQV